MSRPLVVAVGIITAGLWLAAVTGTILASDGRELHGALYVLNRPVVTTLAGVLSIGLIAWRLTRPMVKASLIWTVAFGRGREYERTHPGIPVQRSTVSQIHAVR